MRFILKKKVYKPIKEHIYFNLKCSVCGREYERYYNKPFRCERCKLNAYPSNWISIKNKIIERDNFKCQLCFRHQNAYVELHVHHKDKNRFNSNYDNLITLCQSCHISQHKVNFKKPINIVVGEFGTRLYYQ